MNIHIYRFDISRATDAATLHAFRQDIAEDDTLTAAEKAALEQTLNDRFAALNAQAVGQQKPRW
jgi:hypothetical protein